MRTDVERNAIAAHLTYELAMLWGAAGALGKAESKTLNNCAIEAFAIHARNLIDFFYAEPQKDDLVASHFFSGPGAWASIRPKLPAVLEDARRRANKEISHLTYARLLVTEDNKPWPVNEIISGLEAALDVFCRRADLLPESVGLLRYRDLLV